MESDKNVFDEFQKALQKAKGNLHILKSAVPVEKQMEYFRYSEQIRANRSEETVDDHIATLNSGQASYEAIKRAMAFLAVSGDVKAYRALEQYSKDPGDKLLSDWATLSVLQARITLDTELSDEKPVFISTGLGGEGSRLRLYAFFKSEGLRPFSKYQRDLIQKEIPFHIHRCDGRVEEIIIKKNYFSVLFLIDLRTDLKTLLLAAVNECNEYGNFIQTNFIVTNIKKFDQDDILNELYKK